MTENVELKVLCLIEDGDTANREDNYVEKYPRI